MRVNQWVPITFDNAKPDKQEAYLMGIIQAFGCTRADIPLHNDKGTMKPLPEFKRFYDSITDEIRKAEKMLSKYD